jgi:hypothetical protein
MSTYDRPGRPLTASSRRYMHTSIDRGLYDQLAIYAGGADKLKNGRLAGIMDAAVRSYLDAKSFQEAGADFPAYDAA